MKTPIFVVLAGGVGKNFSPLVTPKSIFPFFGKPLITHVIELVEKAGAKKVIVVCNEENKTIVENLNKKTLEVRTVLQTEANGQAAAIKLVAPLIEDDQSIIILNAVDLIDERALKNFIKKTVGSYACILGMRVKEYFPGGYLQINGEKLMGIIEKPKKGEEPSDVANLFFHYFSKPKKLFDLIAKQAGSDDAYERSLDNLMQSEEIRFVIYDGYWQKLKQSHHVLDMSKLFLNHKLKNKISRKAFIDKLAKIDGPVQIEAGAKIMAGAVIKGPSYIGKNVIVGNHTLIRDSIVEEGSVIGFGSEVARSYIGPNCSLHHNFIGDSVLEANVNPSYGTCTANLRFDSEKIRMRLAMPNSEDLLIETDKAKFGSVMAKGVFLGINCSILPGISFGENATAYPGSVISKAVPPKTNFEKS